MTKHEIKAIIDQTIKEFNKSPSFESSSAKGKSPAHACSTIHIGSANKWLCSDVEEAVHNAQRAQQVLLKSNLEDRARFISAMRDASRLHAKSLAELAHTETGYGSTAHKVLKNLLAADKTPGLEDLGTSATSGDDGLTLVEMAPWGVIGSITPSTNPTSTIINNAISMITAGNAVVFNPHPGAKRASQEAMRILNEAIKSAGGPETLLTTVNEPTLQTGNDIMKHPEIKLLSITGGEAVVAQAMKYPKRVIAAGPGNPPVIVDDSANIAYAAKCIVDGASFDNNVLCVAEKEVFSFSNITDELIKEMTENQGAWLISGSDIDKVARTVLTEKEGVYAPNRNFVGRDASFILKACGISFYSKPRLIIAEVPKDHPFVMTEMLLPVLPIVRVKDIDEAVENAIIAEKGNQHSAMIHSQLIGNLTYVATALDTTIFVKNAPSYSGLGFGGMGFTSLTISTPTGEGLTSARTFTRARRCVLKGDLRVV